MASADETTPLFGAELVPKDDSTFAPPSTTETSPKPPTDRRAALFDFLEAKTPAGLRYESFTIFLIFLSLATFIGASLFLPEYNDAPIATKCGKWCDCGK